MSRDELRVHYSGFIIFAAQILSVITGVIFTLLLTRNMTQTEYGVWNNIFDVGTYFTLASGLFPFWATRFVARRKEGAVKTGLLANLVVASSCRRCLCSHSFSGDDGISKSGFHRHLPRCLSSGSKPLPDHYVGGLFARR